MQRKVRTYFTLLELIVAMAIFSAMMAILFRFINVAQRAWIDSANRSTVYENARLAFDLIGRDLQCSYYSQNTVPFWHKAEMGSSWGEWRNESLAFITTDDTPPFDNCDSKFCEIKYQLHYPDNATAPNEGWLMRSVTGDHVNPAIGGGGNPKWNYHSNFNVSRDNANSAFSGNAASSDPYSRVIPYVTGTSFKCFRNDGTEIPADTTGSSDTEFPSSVQVTILLMDRFSYKKWKALDTAGASEAPIFKAGNSYTFKKTFFLGEKGQ